MTGLLLTQMTYVIHGMDLNLQLGRIHAFLNPAHIDASASLCWDDRCQLPGQ